MSEDLFRKEAVEFATQRLYGHVVVLPKVGHAWALLFVVVCVALGAATLLTGQHIDSQVITGELRFEGARGASVSLRLPPELARYLAPGQTLAVDVIGFNEELGRLDARVVNVPVRRSIERPSGSEPGRLYVAATASVDRDALARAGLPESADIVLPVQTTVITRRESWLRWLIGVIGLG